MMYIPPFSISSTAIKLGTKIERINYQNPQLTFWQKKNK